MNDKDKGNGFIESRVFSVSTFSLPRVKRVLEIVFLITMKLKEECPEKAFKVLLFLRIYKLKKSTLTYVKVVNEILIPFDVVLVYFSTFSNSFVLCRMSVCLTECIRTS